MSYGKEYLPPVAILPVFNPASFDHSTSRISTIDVTTLQQQTDDVTLDADTQLIKYQNIGTSTETTLSGAIVLNTPASLGNATNTSSTAWYVIQVECYVIQSTPTQLITSMTYTDNTTGQSLSWNATSAQSYGPTIIGAFLTKGNDTTYSATLTTVATGTASATSFGGYINIIKIS